MKKLTLLKSMLGIALMLFGVSTTLAADGDVIFHETFDACSGTGGNDDQWKGTIASNSIPSSLSEWDFSGKAYGGDRCVRLGNGSTISGATSPSISFTNGTKYTLIFRAGAWTGGATVKVKLGDTQVGSNLTLQDSNFATYAYELNPTGAATVTIELAGKKRFFLDDIMILEGSKVNVTIASSGWSTMATPAGLDFSNATPAGLTAYIASSVSGSGVTLTSVNEAAGAEGVMLKGTAGETYSIPIKADATKTGTNKLSAAYSATPADADKIYILKDGKFCLVNTGGTKVPAGKAYLLASEVPSGAHDLTINFGSNGDVTGISDMKTMRNVENEKFYNLAGQLVAQPAKGLYITNGRKVVLK